MPAFGQLLLGFILAAAIGLAAYWRGSLSRSGVLGAVLLGTAIFGLGGWAWGALLVAFFVSSSALSHFRQAAKESLSEKFSKGHQRDLAQTLANGGAAALIATAGFVWPGPLWWAAFAGALAAVNADTWATELGVLSRSKPRLVTTFATVDAGTSGAVSAAGTLAALAGAALIGWLASASAAAGWVASTPSDARWAIYLAAVVPAAGLLGSLFDSFLGATVQAIYFCDACRRETERAPRHTCGTVTRRVRGWRWLDNDWVNFLCSLVGAAAALLPAVVLIQ